MFKLHDELSELEPNLLVSSPDAALYMVVDVKNVVKPGFDSVDFVMYCAQEGSVNYEGVDTTLLVAPLKGFYKVNEGEANPGVTQMRIALVESEENMTKVPKLFVELLKQYEERR